LTIARPASFILFVVLLCAGDSREGQAQVPSGSLTPGTAAALVFPQGDEDRNRLASAIGDPDPQVRAVAARVAAVLIRKDLGPALADRLTKEDDLPAASEQTRAVLVLQRDAALTAARAAASRLGGDVLLALAEWLARNAPTQLSAGFGELTKGVPEETSRDLGRIAAVAVQQTPAHLEAMSLAVADGGGIEAWRGYIDAIAESGMDYTRLLIRGLAASDPALRTVTWWFTLSSPAVAETSKAAMTAALAQDGSQDTAWAGVARQLWARRLTGAAPVDQSEVFRQHAEDARRYLGALSATKELTGAERLALKTVVSQTFPTEPPPPRAVVPFRPRVVSARNFTAIVPGFIQSVFAATGCKAGSRYDILTGARMLYRLDGRPQQVAVDTTKVSDACAAVVRILGNLALAERDEAVGPERQVWMLLPTAASIVACIDEPPSASPTRVSAGRVQPPKKIKHVNPQYPAGAQKAGIQGTVIVEAMISSSGCVKRAAVTRSVALSLDLEALQTVSQWRFSPTLLGGQAVPVIMTVTVNFTLQ